MRKLTKAFHAEWREGFTWLEVSYYSSPFYPLSNDCFDFVIDGQVSAKPMAD